MKAKKWLLRVLLYIFGQFVLALGVNLSILSNLGVSPVSSVPYVIFRVLGFHGIESLSLGTCVTLVYIVYMVLQFVLLGRQFKPVNLLQLAASTLFGWFVDFFKWALSPFMLENYVLRLLVLAGSMVVIALGMLLYLGAELIPMPGDGLSLAITKRVGKYPFHKMKMFIDCGFVLTSVLISLIGTGQVLGIREGTLLLALLVGRIMGPMGKAINPFIRRLFFDGKPAGEKV